MSVPTSADVVVVGAGLAGLAATIHLSRAGLDVHLVEAAPHVGGRVASDVVDGFVIDRGFQVIATAYPELRALIDLDELDLRPFVSGVGIYGGGRVHRLVDPRVDLRALASAASAPLGTFADRAQLVAYALGLIADDASDLMAADDVPAIEAFRGQGLSERAINRALRPFLRGVLLEDGLDTSRRFVDLAIRSMLKGPVAVPAAGMGRLPEVIARLIAPGQRSMSCALVSLDGEGVQTDDGMIRTRNVVVATDPASASALLPGLHVPAMRSVTTVFHAADHPPWPEGLLLVDGERNLIANTVVMTEVTSTYSLDGRSLIATSVLGHGHDEALLDRRLRPRLATIYGADPTPWQLVAVRQIEAAVPAMPAPHNFRQPVRHSTGRYVAGDHRDSGSLQGALVSGRRAAEALLADAAHGP